MEPEMEHNAAIHTESEIISVGRERGIAWIVTRAPGGWHCVYWGVPQSHPLHGKHYREWSQMLRIDLTYDSSGALTGSKQPLPIFDIFDIPPDRPWWWVGFDSYGWGVTNMAVERAACAIARCGCIELAEYAVMVGVEGKGEAQP